MEAWIRSQKPPVGPDEELRLGFRDDALIAVGAAVLAERREEVHIVKLQAIAVSATERGRDGAVADQLLDEMLAASVRITAGASRTIVVAWVHPRNEPSRRLLKRGGLAYRGPAPHGYEEWVIQVG